MTNDVGPMGEAVVPYWTSQVGIITVSSKDHDEAGWDFFLQWRHPAPDARPLSLPLDRQPGPIQCLLQVKATRGRPRRWDVKLSNWWRFVDSPLPCFFLVLEFDQEVTCQRAFLVHVDRRHIHDVLKRLRELDVGRGDVRLHRHNYALTWTQADALDSLDGAGLKARIEAHVGQDLHAYGEHKVALTTTVGYERGGKQISGRVRPPASWKGDPRDLLTDFKLGLVSQLEVAGGEVIDTRFGIPAREPDVRFEQGRIGSDGVAPVGKARVRFAVAALGRELDLVMAVRVVSEDAVPGEAVRSKVRLSAPFIDLSWWFDRREASFRLTLPGLREAHPLGDLQPVANLLALLGEARRADAEVELTARYDGEHLCTARLAGSALLVEPQLEWADLVRFAWSAAKAVDLPLPEPVRVEDLMRHRDELRLIYVLLNPVETGVRVDTTVTSPETEPTTPWCVPVAVTAPIGGGAVQVAGCLVGRPEVIGTDAEGYPRYRLEKPDVRLEVRRAYEAPGRPEQTNRELRDALAAKYAPAMKILEVDMGF